MGLDQYLNRRPGGSAYVQVPYTDAELAERGFTVTHALPSGGERVATRDGDTLTGEQLTWTALRLNGEDVPSIQIAYWRKHPDLQGYMERLYRERGGTGVFNCVPLELSEADCRAVIEAVRDRALPHTTGFFFGESSDEDMAPTIQAMEDAIEAIRAGDIVEYDSWW